MMNILDIGVPVVGLVVAIIATLFIFPWSKR